MSTAWLFEPHSRLPGPTGPRYPSLTLISPSCGELWTGLWGKLWGASGSVLVGWVLGISSGLPWGQRLTLKQQRSGYMGLALPYHGARKISHTHLQRDP